MSAEWLVGTRRSAKVGPTRDREASFSDASHARRVVLSPGRPADSFRSPCRSSAHRQASPVVMVHFERHSDTRRRLISGPKFHHGAPVSPRVGGGAGSIPMAGTIQNHGQIRGGVTNIDFWRFSHETAHGPASVYKNGRSFLRQGARRRSIEEGAPRQSRRRADLCSKPSTFYGPRIRSYAPGTGDNARSARISFLDAARSCLPAGLARGSILIGGRRRPRGGAPFDPNRQHRVLGRATD